MARMPVTMPLHDNASVSALISDFNGSRSDWLGQYRAVEVSCRCPIFMVHRRRAVPARLQTTILRRQKSRTHGGVPKEQRRSRQAHSLQRSFNSRTIEASCLRERERTGTLVRRPKAGRWACHLIPSSTHPCGFRFSRGR